jgi:hypothetical protein
VSKCPQRISFLSAPEQDVTVNNRTYRIAPSSLHVLGLFSMDGIIVKYNTVTELMDYVRPCYNYNDWMRLV